MDDVKVTMRAVLMSEKDGVALNKLQSDYERLAGPLDYRKLGYSTLKSLINDIPDTVRLVLSRKTGLEMCVAVSDASTAHIASLVSKQKSKKTRSSIGSASYRGSFKPPPPHLRRSLQPNSSTSTYFKSSTAAPYRGKSSQKLSFVDKSKIVPSLSWNAVKAPVDKINVGPPNRGISTKIFSTNNVIQTPLRDQINLGSLNHRLSTQNLPFADKNKNVPPFAANVAEKTPLHDKINIHSESNICATGNFTIPQIPKRFEKCQVLIPSTKSKQDDLFSNNDKITGKLSAPKSPNFMCNSTYHSLKAVDDIEFCNLLQTNGSQFVDKKQPTIAEMVVEVEMPATFDWPGGEASLRGVLRSVIQQFPSGLKLDCLPEEFLRYTGLDLPHGVSSCLKNWQDVVRIEHGFFDILFPTEDRSLQPKVPPVGFSGSVIMNYVSESDNLIYLMESARFEEYRKMTNDMQTYYNMGEGKFAHPLTNEEWNGGYCAALYEDVWYRGRVVRQIARRPSDVETMLCVDFSEFGNMDPVASSNVYALAPQFFTLPGSAFSFEFADFVVTNESLFVRTMKEEIIDKGVHMHLRVTEISRGNAMVRGQLLLDNRNFAERLMEMGCMERECSVELLKYLSLELTDDTSVSSSSSENTCDVEEDYDDEENSCMVVISVKSLNIISALRQEKENIVQDLHEKMKRVFTGTNCVVPTLSQIEVGVDIAARVKNSLSTEEQFRRVRVIRVVSDIQIEVQELDLGDFRVISIRDLVPLPDECSAIAIPYQIVDLKLNLLDESPSHRSQLNAINRYLCAFPSIKVLVSTEPNHLVQHDANSSTSVLPCVDLESLDGQVLNYDVLRLSLDIRLLSHGDNVHVFVLQTEVLQDDERFCRAFVVQQRPLFRQLHKEMMTRLAEASLSNSLEKLHVTPSIGEILLARHPTHGWVRLRVVSYKDSICCVLIDFGIELSYSIFELYRLPKGSKLAFEVMQIPERGTWVKVRCGDGEPGLKLGDHTMNIEDPNHKPFPLVNLKLVK